MEKNNKKKLIIAGIAVSLVAIIGGTVGGVLSATSSNTSNGDGDTIIAASNGVPTGNGLNPNLTVSEEVRNKSREVVKAEVETFNEVFNTDTAKKEIATEVEGLENKNGHEIKMEQMDDPATGAEIMVHVPFEMLEKHVKDVFTNVDAKQGEAELEKRIKEVSTRLGKKIQEKIKSAGKDEIKSEFKVVVDVDESDVTPKTGGVQKLDAPTLIDQKSYVAEYIPTSEVTFLKFNGGTYEEQKKKQDAYLKEITNHLVPSNSASGSSTTSPLANHFDEVKTFPLNEGEILDHDKYYLKNLGFRVKVQNKNGLITNYDKIVEVNRLDLAPTISTIIQLTEEINLTIAYASRFNPNTNSHELRLISQSLYIEDADAKKVSASFPNGDVVLSIEPHLVKEVNESGKKDTPTLITEGSHGILYYPRVDLSRTILTNVLGTDDRVIVQNGDNIAKKFEEKKVSSTGLKGGFRIDSNNITNALLLTSKEGAKYRPALERIKGTFDIQNADTLDNPYIMPDVFSPSLEEFKPTFFQGILKIPFEEVTANSVNKIPDQEFVVSFYYTVGWLQNADFYKDPTLSLGTYDFSIIPLSSNVEDARFSTFVDRNEAINKATQQISVTTWANSEGNRTLGDNLKDGTEAKGNIHDITNPKGLEPEVDSKEPGDAEKDLENHKQEDFKRELIITSEGTTIASSYETVWHTGANKLIMTKNRREQIYELNSLALRTYDVFKMDEVTVNKLFGPGAYEDNSDKYIYATIAKSQDAFNKRMSAKYDAETKVEGANIILHYGDKTNKDYATSFTYTFKETPDPERPTEELTILAIDFTNFTVFKKSSPSEKLRFKQPQQTRSHAPDTFLFTPAPVSLTGTIPAAAV